MKTTLIIWMTHLRTRILSIIEVKTGVWCEWG